MSIYDNTLLYYFVKIRSFHLCQDKDAEPFDN